MPILKRYQIKIFIFNLLEKCGLKDDRLFFAVTIGVALFCGFTAVAFKKIIEKLFTFFYHTPHFEAWYFYLIIPALGGLLAGLIIHYFTPEARGSGVPELKLALYARNGAISLKTVLGKFFLSALCIGTGHPTGREDPTLYITGGIASAIARFLYFSREKMQTLVQVGATAGFAAAFNTPLAAITFTLEKIVGNFNAKILGTSVIAAVVASMVERSFFGNVPLFYVPTYNFSTPTELLFCLFLGIVSGVVSVIFIHGLLYTRMMFRNKLNPRTRPLQPFFGGIIIGLIALISKNSMGIGYNIVNQALFSELAITVLLILLLLKLGGTIISYASGNAGGILAPTLFIGAMTGGFMGQLISQTFPAVTADSGTYALIGMGASFAGIIRAPMTSVLLIFEMTHDYSIIVPLMITNMMSYAISERFSKTPVYDALALQDGIHLPNPNEQEFFKELHVGEIMQIDLITFLYNWPVMRVIKNRELKYSRYPVVDIEGNFIGLVSSNDIQKEYLKKHFHKKLYKITESDPEFRIYPDQSVEIALRKMGQKGIKTIPVVDRENSKNLLGIVTASDIFKAYGIKDTNLKMYDDTKMHSK